MNLAESIGEENETRCKNVARDFLNHAVCCGFGSAGTITIQDGLNPVIHGAERCSRNWSDWKQKVEGNSEMQFHFASATASEHVG